MTRAYLRLDPGFDEHKHAYPDGAYAALIATFCLAESQPQRGRFRSLAYFKALLGERGRWAKFLLEHGDVVQLPDGRIYVEGWDEWQEGDWKVGERVRRIRGRRGPGPGSGGGGVTPDVTPDVTAATVTDETAGTVYNLSDGGRLSAGVIDGAGAGGALAVALAETESPSGEDRTKPQPAPERADIQALLDRGWRQVTEGQRAILDEVLEQHDVTGPEWAAQLIRETPANVDPLDRVKRAHTAWQWQHRQEADAQEAEAAERRRDQRTRTATTSGLERVG